LKQNSKINDNHRAVHLPSSSVVIQWPEGRTYMNGLIGIFQEG